MPDPTDGQLITFGPKAERPVSEWQSLNGHSRYPGLGEAGNAASLVTQLLRNKRDLDKKFATLDGTTRSDVYSLVEQARTEARGRLTIVDMIHNGIDRRLKGAAATLNDPEAAPISADRRNELAPRIFEDAVDGACEAAFEIIAEIPVISDAVKTAGMELTQYLSTEISQEPGVNFVDQQKSLLG